MIKNTSEILFCTGEDGKLNLLAMCIAPKPGKPRKPRASKPRTPKLRAPKLLDKLFAFHCKKLQEPQNPELEQLDEILNFSLACENIPAPSCSASCDSDENQEALDSFKQQTQTLIDLGFTDEQIMEIIKGCRKKRHILIDRHLKVFLVDDTMVEVEMNPLSKTLFLFYLKHPEGVALKCLSDYKTELNGIYSKLTGRESVEDIEKSIRDLVDPTSNSVHEKCSRIKAAFKDKVSTSTVSDYVPSGAPGEPRFISLDRNLVTWEGSL